MLESLPPSIIEHVLDYLLHDNGDSNNFSLGSLMSLTSANQALRLLYDSDHYWSRRVSSFFSFSSSHLPSSSSSSSSSSSFSSSSSSSSFSSSSGVSLIILSTAFDIHSSVVCLQNAILKRVSPTSNLNLNSNSSSLSLPSLWKYIYWVNKYINKDVGHPEYTGITIRRNTNAYLVSRTSDPKYNIYDYSLVRQFLLLLQNRVIAKWPWLAVTFTEKVSNITPTFLSNRYQHTIPFNTVDDNPVRDPKEAKAKYPSIRFLNGGHYGQGGLYTYSEVLEFYIVSSKQLEEQMEELMENRNDNEKEGNNENRNSKENTYRLEVVLYRLQDERPLDIKHHATFPLPSLSLDLLDANHSFLNSIFTNLASKIVIFLPQCLKDVSPEYTFEMKPKWKLICDTMKLFDDKLDKRLVRGAQLITSTTVGDPMSCHHVLRRKIRTHLDDMLVKDTTKLNNNNNNNKSESNTNDKDSDNNNKKNKNKNKSNNNKHKESKTIEIAIERCIRRHTKYFLQGLFNVYQWDQDEPTLQVLLDCFKNTPVDNEYKACQYQGHDFGLYTEYEKGYTSGYCLLSIFRSHFQSCGGFETVPPNSLIVLPALTRNAEEFQLSDWLANSWHYWPLGIKALALDLMPLIFKWIQLIIRGIIDKHESHQKRDGTEKLTQKFGKQKDNKMEKDDLPNQAKQAILDFVDTRKQALLNINKFE